MLVHLILSQRSLRASSVLFILSSLFCSSEVISTILSSSSLIRSSASDVLLLIPSAAAAAAAASSLQSCPILCDPIDSSPPGSTVPGLLQARTLEWVAISFSRGSSRPRNQTRVSFIAGRFFTAEPPGKSNYGVAKSRTRLSDFTFTFQFHCQVPGSRFDP